MRQSSSWRSLPLLSALCTCAASCLLPPVSLEGKACVADEDCQALRCVEGVCRGGERVDAGEGDGEGEGDGGDDGGPDGGVPARDAGGDAGSLACQGLSGRALLSSAGA